MAVYTFARKPDLTLKIDARATYLRGSASEIVAGTHFGSYIEHQNPPSLTYCVWTEDGSYCTASVIISAPTNKIEHKVRGDIVHYSSFSTGELQRATPTSIVELY